jgi:hypothetical protein
LGKVRCRQDAGGGVDGRCPLTRWLECGRDEADPVGAGVGFSDNHSLTEELGLNIHPVGGLPASAKGRLPGVKTPGQSVRLNFFVRLSDRFLRTELVCRGKSSYLKGGSTVRNTQGAVRAEAPDGTDI